jgi:NAD(P)-dependent dehydrogenase (short-subunit alcohol dehydrogenase family)
MNIGRVLLITGGSRGIGAATARAGAQEGYWIAVNYRHDENAANKLVEEIRAQGGKAVAIQGDVAQEIDIKTLFAAVERELGPLTHLVNNAGIVGRAARLVDADPAVVREVIDLNVTGAILVAREAVRRMATSAGGKGGAIVNLSSMAATLGAPGEYTWYAASKGAIDAFTVGLSREVAKDGIRVNAVAPGLIDTDIHTAGGQPDRVARLGASVPLGRGGTAAEVAAAILWLLSDAASYVTGTIVRVSGGR